MCECLENEDGSMYLCSACTCIWKNTKELGVLAARVCQSYRSAVNSLESIDEDRERLHKMASDFLPSLADLQAMNLNITGGMDSADYVRQMRDGAIDPLQHDRAE